MLKGLLTELCLIRSVIILVTKQICVDHSYDYSVLGLSWTPLGPIIINFLFSTEMMVNQHTMSLMFGEETLLVLEWLLL